MIEILKNTPNMMWTPSIPTRLAGLSKNEIKSMLMPMSSYSQDNKVKYDNIPPKSFDWSTLRPECIKIRDQGNCGGCWAFSSVGPFSDNRCIYRKDKNHVQYSEEYMITCDK